MIQGESSIQSENRKKHHHSIAIGCLSVVAGWLGQSLTAMAGVPNGTWLSQPQNSLLFLP